MNRLFRHWGATPQRIVDGMNESFWTALKGFWEMVPVSMFGMDGGSLPVVPQVCGARRHRRGKRPAGGSRPFPQRKINDPTDEKENTAVRPLSVEAEEFSLGIE